MNINEECVRFKYDGVHSQKTKVIKTREHSNSWRLLEMASFSGFILCGIRPFYWNVFVALDYKQTGRKGHDRRFLMDLSLNHTLIRDSNTLDLAEKLYPQTLFRDISFWLSKEWREYMDSHSFADFVDDIDVLVQRTKAIINQFLFNLEEIRARGRSIDVCEPQIVHRTPCSCRRRRD